MYLFFWCSGAGQVLADNVLLLQSVETLSIRDINPKPILQVLSRNSKHSVSSMGISLEHKPDLVRCVSMDTCSTGHTPRGPQVYLYSLCVYSPAIVMQ